MNTKSPNINNSMKPNKIKKTTTKLSLIKKIESDEIMIALKALGRWEPISSQLIHKDNQNIQ